LRYIFPSDALPPDWEYRATRYMTTFCNVSIPRITICAAVRTERAGR
jgi:hypothetical protein